MVSVFVITYNHEKFIAQALDGILMQQVNFEYEVVVGEDCSTDRTREILLEYAKKYPDKFVLLLHDKNIGAMANQMAVLKACTGKYIALCEGDDYWSDPLKLQKQVDFLEKNKEYAICYHRVNYLGKNGVLQNETLNQSSFEKTFTIEDLAKGNIMHTCSVLFRKKSQYFEEIKDAQLPACDYVLHMLNAVHGNIKYMPEIMAIYRHEVGIWSSLTEKEMLKKWMLGLNFLLIKFASYPQVLRALCKQKIRIKTWLHRFSVFFEFWYWAIV